MDILSAIRLIDQVIYRPGWKITATDHSKRFEGTVCVRIEYPAQETSREMALAGYPESNRPYATFPITVRDLDDTHLYRELLAAILEIEAHEAREYLRINPTGWAPFHPHQIDGMRRWLACGTVTGQVIGDLQFGIA